MISIRHETEADHGQVRRLIVDAFVASEFGHHGEAELVEQLRENCEDLLSLVAIEGGLVVGHILFSPVTIRSPKAVIHGMGLAPMATAPAAQRTGIGTQLVVSGFEQLVAAGCQFVVVLGHPEYYPRFGFKPASQFGVTHGFAGIPQDVFFVKLLSPDVPNVFENGQAIFRSEFGPQHASDLQ